MHSLASLPDAGIRGSLVDATAGKQLQKLVKKALKMSHPRERESCACVCPLLFSRSLSLCYTLTIDPVEIVNSTVAPPTTAHSFIVCLPKEKDQDVLGTQSLGRAAYQRTGLGAGAPQMHTTVSQTGSSVRETIWHGVCLNVWLPADKERARRLKLLQAKLASTAPATDLVSCGPDESTLMLMASSAVSLVSPEKRGSRVSLAGTQTHHADHRASGRVPHKKLSQLSGEKSGSETEPAWTDSEFEGGVTGGRRPMGRLSGFTQSLVFSDVDGAVLNVFQPEGDGTFWIPYALTLSESDDRTLESDFTQVICF